MSSLPVVTFGPEIWSLQNEGGISRYFQQLIEGLSKSGVSGKVLFRANSNSRVASSIFENFEKELLINSRNPYKEISQRLSQNNKPTIYHPTYYSKNLSRAKNQQTRIVVTVFDMISEIFPEPKPLFRKVMDEKRISVDIADHILVISHQTKKDLMKIYGVPDEKISVTYLGSNLHLVPKVDFASLPKVPFILYVGKRGGYKNFSNLVAAYSHSEFLRSNFSIVALGGGPFNQEEKSKFQKLGVADRLSQINVNDEELAMFYRKAVCLIYPSLYEGFGLPPIEAMSLDCPVIASSGGSIPEICQDAATYFNPSLIESIQQTLEVTLQSEHLMNEMRKKGLTVSNSFTWENTVKETLNAYQRVINQ